MSKFLRLKMGFGVQNMFKSNLPTTNGSSHVPAGNITIKCDKQKVSFLLSAIIVNKLTLDINWRQKKFK